MCGIVGYTGLKQADLVLVPALQRLEYRGYDSAGLATIFQGRIQLRKKAGKIHNLVQSLQDFPILGTTGISHTRWATHGPANDVNAHPHISEDGSIAVIHNGIIENFAMLRDKLIADGVTLRSQTDTEVVAHLLSKQMKTTPGLADALREVCQVLTGAFTLVVVHAVAGLCGRLRWSRGGDGIVWAAVFAGGGRGSFVSRQRADCGGLVSDGGARPSFGNF